MILGIALLFGVLVLVLGVVVGPRAVGVLYALAAPPDAPVPDNLNRVSHTSETHGVDAWVYNSTTVNACEIVRFYEELDGTCVLEPGWCRAGDPNTTDLYTQPVAECSGSSTFSIFHMRWQADISAGYRGQSYAQVNVSRSIFWTGAPESTNP